MCMATKASCGHACGGGVSCMCRRGCSLSLVHAHSSGTQGSGRGRGRLRAHTAWPHSFPGLAFPQWHQLDWHQEVAAQDARVCRGKTCGALTGSVVAR